MANGPFAFDRVRDTSTTTGTGALTLSGTAPTGFRAFGSVLADGDLVRYAVAHQTANEWEAGVGTYAAAGPTLTRTRIKDSSAGVGTAVNFSAGTKDVFIAPLAADLGWLPDVTPPPASGWTWDNQGAATLTLWGNNCRAVRGPAPATVENVRAQYRTLPAAPYKIEAGLLVGLTGVEFGGAVAGWRSSGGAYRFAAVRQPAADYLRYASTSGATGGTFTGIESIRNPNQRGPALFLRFEDDNTNRLISISGDLVNWVPFTTAEGRTTGMTAAQFAFGTWNYDKESSVSLVHYREY